jgi:hypothetical protein
MKTNLNDTYESDKSKKLKVASRISVIVKGISNCCLVSETTIRRWIRDGKLSGLRLPSSQHRITAVDFNDFLNQYGILNKEL